MVVGPETNVGCRACGPATACSCAAPGPRGTRPGTASYLPPRSLLLAPVTEKMAGLETVDDNVMLIYYYANMHYYII